MAKSDLCKLQILFMKTLLTLHSLVCLHADWNADVINDQAQFCRQKRTLGERRQYGKDLGSLPTLRGQSDFVPKPLDNPTECLPYH